MKKKIYALYKGDKFIDIGTKEYLAQLLGVTQKTIEFYAKPVQIRRNGGNGYVVVRIEEDEEDVEFTE